LQDIESGTERTVLCLFAARAGEPRVRNAQKVYHRLPSSTEVGDPDWRTRGELRGSLRYSARDAYKMMPGTRCRMRQEKRREVIWPTPFRPWANANRRSGILGASLVEQAVPPLSTRKN